MARKQPTIEDVPSKYRVHTAGEYNAAIFRCIDWECVGKFCAETIQGFTECAERLVVVHECPKCGSRQYWHVKSFDYLETLLRAMKLIERKPPKGADHE